MRQSSHQGPVSSVPCPALSVQLFSFKCTSSASASGQSPSSQCPVSNFPSPISSVLCPVPRVQCPTFSVRFPVSSVEPPSIKHLVPVSMSSAPEKTTMNNRDKRWWERVREKEKEIENSPWCFLKGGGLEIGPGLPFQADPVCVGIWAWGYM
jgi:hypothetical protein